MGERADTGGLATALRLLGVAGGAHVADGGQADFFESQDAPLPVKGTSAPKGGRPTGARNRSTEEWVRLFLAQHRAPLSVLGNIASQPLGELVDQLQAMADKHKKWRETADGGYWNVVQIDPLQVMKLQAQVATALAPYIHKQQPKALEIDGKPRGVVILGEIEAAEAGDDEALTLPINNSLENNDIAPNARPQSDARKSDEGENCSVLKWQEPNDS